MNRIAGIICSLPDPAVPLRLGGMLQRMRHVPTSVSGQESFVGGTFHAGWCDESDTSRGYRPVWNEDRSVCLIFAGEEFAVSQPHEDANATRLLAFYEQCGSAFFERLNGWFSGVIADLRHGTLTVFNDRYGLGRVYYTQSANGFFFASEAKSLLAVVPQTRALDPRGLAELMSVGCALQNRTLYSGIFLLPPASCWTFYRDGRIEKRRYFDPATWEQCSRLDAATYADRLKHVLGQAVRRCARSTQGVAMSLTGGLDSRMLLAWANASPGSMPCYTFGGPIRDCADVRIARRIAAICHQPHTTIRIQDAFFQDFASLAEKTVQFSDGAMDVSGAVELYINRCARDIAPIRLTGNYGSEILRANVAFRPRRIDTSIFSPEFARLIDEVAETYRNEALGHRLSFIAFKQVPWFHYARHSVERTELTPRSPFLDNDLVALAYSAPAELAASPQPLLQLIAAGNPSLAAIETDRALRCDTSPISKVANAWQEFTAKAEYAYDYGMPQWLNQADRMLSRLHLERLFLGRHKFYHFRIWYRDQLKEYVRERGNRSRAESPWYRKGVVQEIVEGHVSGRANHTLELHKLLSIQLVEEFLLGQR